MIRNTLIAGMLVLSISTVSHSQINLNAIQSTEVRTGSWLNTKVDTVLIDKNISGIFKSGT